MWPCTRLSRHRALILRIEARLRDLNHWLLLLLFRQDLDGRSCGESDGHLCAHICTIGHVQTHGGMRQTTTRRRRVLLYGESVVLMSMTRQDRSFVILFLFRLSRLLCSTWFCELRCKLQEYCSTTIMAACFLKRNNCGSSICTFLSMV